MPRKRIPRPSTMEKQVIEKSPALRPIIKLIRKSPGRKIRIDDVLEIVSGGNQNYKYSGDCKNRARVHLKSIRAKGIPFEVTGLDSLPNARVLRRKRWDEILGIQEKQKAEKPKGKDSERQIKSRGLPAKKLWQESQQPSRKHDKYRRKDEKFHVYPRDRF